MAPPALLSLPDLPAALAALLRQIPSGRVTTFGDLATALGDVAAARWAAQWIRETATNNLPTHRVVLRTGELRAEQIQPLLAEGVPFVSASRVDLTARWSDFVTEFPLARLRDWQTNLTAHADWTSSVPVPDIVAGVDLSYPTPQTAVAAYVAVEVATGAVVREITITAPVRFPYIPGYLTFRELPTLLMLLDEVRRQEPLAPVILVDGTGRLHPRQSGLAVAVGVCGGCVTIGVSKHQLCGRLRDDDPLDGAPTIWQHDQCLGAILTRGAKRRTVFISAGNGLDLASCVRLVQSVWTTDRWPRPITRADALSRQQGRRLSDPGEPGA
jgi:deoxyribonuclease V